MNTIEQLRAQRKNLVTEARKILDAAKDGDKRLSDQEEARLKELDSKCDELEKQIRFRESFAESDSRGTDPQLESELRQCSLVRAIQHQINPQSCDAGRELEFSQELTQRCGKKPNGLYLPMSIFQKRISPAAAGMLHQRAMSSTQLSLGGALIEETVRGDLYIDRLRAALVTQRLGARVISGLVGDASIPRLKGSVTSYWVGDDDAITAADGEFESCMMRPKHVGCLAEYSRNLLLQSSPDIEQLLRDDFAQTLAGGLDAAAINGQGGKEPVGILNTSGIGSVSMATYPTWAKIIDLIAEVEIDDGNLAAAGFVTNGYGVKRMRQKAKGATSDDIMLMEDPRILAGFPCAVTSAVPHMLPGTSGSYSALIFGDFNDLLVGYWSAFDLLVNPYESTAYAKGSVQIRGIITADILPRHAESFAAVQDMQTE